MERHGLYVTHLGLPLFHSRRAFAPGISRLEAGLISLKWSVDALQDLRVKRVILELSSVEVVGAINSLQIFPHLSFFVSGILRLLHNFDHCQVVLVPGEINVIATDIAISVTKDRHFQ